MLNIRLFGKLSLQQCNARLDRLRFGKMAELFCYLLVRRGRPHSREALGAVLWGDSTTAQSKKYLRQVLWQLQGVLRVPSPAGPMLVVDRDSVKIVLDSGVWMDLAAFEDACVPLQQVPVAALSSSQAAALKNAVDLYRGDLLEGWYQDWCLFERERLENLYLVSVEKLMCYSEQHKDYDLGLEMAERILRVDRAHERTYQAMMRMETASGHRAEAIRSYQRCENALRQELGVAPASPTLELVRKIREDSTAPTVNANTPAQNEPAVTNVGRVVARLRRVVMLLNEAQAAIEKEVEALSRGETHPKLKLNSSNQH